MSHNFLTDRELFGDEPDLNLTVDFLMSADGKQFLRTYFCESEKVEVLRGKEQLSEAYRTEADFKNKTGFGFKTTESSLNCLCRNDASFANFFEQQF